MTTFKATESQIAALRKKCACMELENWEILDHYPDGQLALIYNGIGPDNFPDWLTEALEDIAPELAPACLIHDVEFVESDGTWATFKSSNARLAKNGRITARYMYSIWRLRRYVVKWNARTFARACQKYGWDIWKGYHDFGYNLAPCAVKVAGC